MQSAETIEQPVPSLQDQFDSWLDDVRRSEEFLQPIDPMERPLNAVSLGPEFAI